MEHQAIFMYKLLYNHFCCSIPVSFNCDFHDYYTRSRNDIRKSSTTRRWGHWSSVNFSSNIWNRVDTSLREAETLSSFKCGLSKAILWYVYVHLYVFNQIYICLDFIQSACTESLDGQLQGAITHPSHPLSLWLVNYFPQALLVVSWLWVTALIWLA